MSQFWEAGGEACTTVASNKQRSGMLLNIVLCTKHTQQKVIWPINVSSTEVEEFSVDPLFSPC